MEHYLDMIVGGLFSILIVVLGWIGQRVHHRLDSLTNMLADKLEQMNNKLGGIERDLRSELVTLDRRVTRVEAEHSSRIGQ